MYKCTVTLPFIPELSLTFRSVRERFIILFFDSYTRFGFSFETYFANDFSMNTEYTCRMNNKWDRFAGFHARTTANGFSRFNAAVGNDLEHAVAENNHLIVATTQ